MVLLGYEDVADAATAMEVLSANQELAGRRQVLLDDPVMVVTRESGLASVHVLAEEMAFVAPRVHGVDLVASDDATTCSIVVLISGDIVAVAHLDAIKQMAFFLQKWESLVKSTPTKVAVAGGYDDEQAIARPISRDILHALMSSEKVYDVQQFVTSRWNTTETDDGVMMPRARGIGYFPAEDTFRRVEFEPDARLPLVPMRFAGVSPHPLHTLLCCVEKDKPLEITVGPYGGGTLLSPEVCPYMLDLDDGELLPRISTSPFAEGPKFLQDMRDMLDFISNDTYKMGYSHCAIITVTAAMEPSFVANPYVQTPAPSSRKIREILDREEASYEVWRKTRKSVRLPHASLKLNSPLKVRFDSRRDSNQSRVIQFAPKSSGVGSEASSDAARQSRSRSQSGVASMAVMRNKFVKRKDALITGGFTRLLEPFPILAAVKDAGQKQVQLDQMSCLPNKPSEGVIIPSVAPRKAARKKFQQYLYDFHSRQVFSFAKSESEECEDAVKSEVTEKKSPTQDNDLADSTNSESNYSVGWNKSSEEDPQKESHDRQSKYLLSGLGFLSGANYDAIFEIHWKLSEAEKIVRDAVDRNRIREILRKAYRMLLWFFRYYAGNAAYAVASERRTGTGTVTALGEGLFEIPSRFRLLEDLNVQCVDAARFGLTDTPLKREGLINFLINVARMLCTHSSNPTRLKMVTNDGVEMSDAVKTLVHEHFGVFAQVQDVDHFRTIFLRMPEAIGTIVQNSHVAHGCEDTRKLHAIIEMHKMNLANFFEELVSSGAIARSGGVNDKAKVQQRQRGHGIVCTQFLSTLRAIGLITTRGAATAAAINTNADGEASGRGPAGVDEVRAVRIFLSCLPMATIDWHEGASTTTVATASSNPTSSEPRELTLSQFIEAFLRVAFTWKELQICHGEFDVCSNQMTSDRCRCTINPAHYAFDVFDDAVKDIFARIHAYRLKRAQHRTSMRMTIQVKSHRSLRSLVAMASIQRAPTRLLPVDVKPPSNDAGA